MAIWQFDVFLVPEGTVDPVLSDEGLALPLLAESLVVDAHRWLSDRFGAPTTMCEGMLVFGSEDSNRIDLAVDAEGEAEISARIDARSEAKDFCGLIAELAAELGCKLFSPEVGRSMDASAATLAAALMASGAWKYALDPHGTLRRLAGGGSA